MDYNTVESEVIVGRLLDYLSCNFRLATLCSNSSFTFTFNSDTAAVYSPDILCDES